MENIKLGEISEFIRNGASIKQFDNADGYPITRIETISNLKIDFEKMGYANIHELGKYEDYLLKDGDILMSHINSDVHLGKSAIMEEDSKKVIHGMNLLCIRLKQDTANPKYMYYYFNHKLFRNKLTKIIKKSVNQASFSVTDLKKIDIEIPNIETQNKIVEILDKAQSLIDKKNEQIELLDELISSTFIEIFGDIRVNEKGWEEKELSNLLVNIDSGKSFVCEGYERKGDYPAILKLSAVTYGFYNPLENKALINEDEFINNMEVKEGDLLFTRKNTPELVGMSAYVYKTMPNLMMPDLIFRLNTNENCNKIYLWKLINNEMFREKIKMISNGSAKSMSNISKQNLMKLKVPVPPIELQNEFAEFVTQTDSIRSKMETSLSELEDNFNSLMQKAFKGELFN